MERLIQSPARFRCDGCLSAASAPGRCGSCGGEQLDMEAIPGAAMWLSQARQAQRGRAFHQHALHAASALIVAGMLLTGSLPWATWGPRLAHITPHIPLVKRSAAPMMTGLQLEGMEWSGIRLPRPRFEDVRLRRVDILHADLDGAAFVDSSLRHVWLDEVSLVGASWSGCQIWESDLFVTDLTGSRWDRVDMRASSLSEIPLRESRWTKSTLTQVDLSHAALDGAVMEGVSVWLGSLEGADLSGAVLSGVVFGGVNMTGAVLDGADLQGAIFHPVYQGIATDLSGASLRCADLRGARLSGVSLQGVDLSGAVLDGAALDLTGARRDPDTPCPDR